jgi:hypothetical protein
VVILTKIARNEENRWVSHFGQKGIKDLADMYAERGKKISDQIAQLKSKQEGSPEIKALELELARAKSQEQKLNALCDSLKSPN